MKRGQSRRRFERARPRINGRRTWLEFLESRTYLSGDGLVPTYLPAQHNLFNYQGFLCQPSNDAPVAVAERYLRAHVTELGLTLSDLDNYLVTTNYVTAATGITTLTFQQSLNGLPVDHANFNITVMP